MQKTSKIYLAGHTGLVGSAIFRKLLSEGYANILTTKSAQLDLRNQKHVEEFFANEKPEYVIFAAAKVGGVYANSTYPAEFIHDNLVMQNNVIHSAYKNNVKKLMFMGSNCLYPKYAMLPIKESYLLAGKLEPTTEAYAIAKIAGIKMCQAYNKQYGCNFITILPVNMFGPQDNYNLETSHVMPALLSKFITATKNNAPEVEIWGSGSCRREFMHSDDLADACLFLMLNYNDPEPINIGTGEEIAIRDLAALIGEIVGFKGELKFNIDMPDGITSKKLDVTKLNGLGWKHKIGLREGITKVYNELKDKL